MPKTTVLTPGQKKCQALGLSLPLFPLTTVGSFPKQSELIELKYRVSKGFQNPAELDRKEKMAIEQWIREQERLGLDVLVDGELNRSDLVTYFANKIGGFEKGGFVRCYGNRYYRKPIINGRIEWKEHLILDNWRLFQRSTKMPLKAILTGPYTLLDWSFNEYYGSRESALADLTKIIKKEVKALVGAGAKIIQLDEPAMSSRPHEFSLIAEALKEITHGLSAYFILHHSYGDLSPIWAKMQRLPIDNFDIETTNSNFSILDLMKKIPTKKDITVGLIESHRHTVETQAEIWDRIKRVIKVISGWQLWFSPDCGLRTRTYTESRKKLEALQKAVTKARETYS